MSIPWYVPAPGGSDAGGALQRHPDGAGGTRGAGAEPPPAADPGAADRFDACGVTLEGAAWLVSAGTYPRTTLACWTSNPTAPLVLPCGVTFDVVNVPAVFGRRMLAPLWDDGPGSGPVAVHRGRMMLFAAPGTAQRLPALLRWEEWGTAGGGRGGPVPPLLCHGRGDAVTVPPMVCDTAADTPTSRWLVAPDIRPPWLPGPDVLLWACVRAVRAAARIEQEQGREREHDRRPKERRDGRERDPGQGRGGREGRKAREGREGRRDGPAGGQARAGRADPGGQAPGETRISIFPRADQGANVYDVSRRR